MMATLVPSDVASIRQDGGYYRELDIVNTLVTELPAGYEVYHSVGLHTVHDGQDFYGEIDVVVMAPSGALLLMEVKAGGVTLRNGEIFKRYASGESNVGQQCRLQRASLLGRLRHAQLDATFVHCLVLPDFRLTENEVVSIPRQRIVDAERFPQLAGLVREWLDPLPGCTRLESLRRFLHNEFCVMVDLSAARDQLARTTRVLSDGLATWVPRITAPSGVVHVQATAGSGKTQLALRLLDDALQAGQRAGYVCFNRTLADHIRLYASARAEIVNFHELVVEHERRVSGEPDFSQPHALDTFTARYLADSDAASARFDLLIIDEGQDFDPAWIESLLMLLRPAGKLYLMEDADQRLYERPEFDLDGAVTVASRDNYRSPRRVCDVINALQLCGSPIVSKGLYQGEVPGFHLYSGTMELVQKIGEAVESLLSRGFALSDIAVISSRGRAGSALTGLREIGPWRTRQFTGEYSSHGEPIWTEGELLVESVYRYKGQSAPAVVLAEVAFEALTPQEKKKLFVGLTRAQMAVEIVLTADAERTMLEVLAAT